jgi:acetyl esterase/lipase
MYVHGGGWNGTEQDTAGPNVILDEVQRSWDVVTINYRLATSAPGDGVRAPQLMNDVDRALRYAQLHAGELGLNVSRFVISGGSAGGHLALLAAQGAPDATFADPALPPDLAGVKARIDGVVALVAPTDLTTLWKAGGVAAPSQESLLGCTLASAPAIDGMPRCDDPSYVDRYSPLAWSKQYQARGVSLPPAYFAYGGSDTLVRIDTQGTPNIEAWSASAGSNRTWFDFPPKADHNIDRWVNEVAFHEWLDRVASGEWTVAH